MALKTERLVLRDYKKGDESTLRKAVDNLKVSRYLAAVPHPYSKKDADWFVGHCIEESKKKPRENYELAISILDKDAVLGCVGLTKVNEFNGTATMGYWLAEDHWRNGYMFEAAREIIRFAFEDLGLRRINIEAFVGNEASNCLIKKLGFRFEGTQLKSHKIKATGKVVDAHIYGMLKSEWKR